MQIMLWIMFAVFCISFITFMIIKTHAGVEAFVSSNSHWTLAHTKAKYALDDYFDSHNKSDFKKFEDHIKICLDIRQSLIAFEQGEYKKGISSLQHTSIHPNNMSDMSFLYRFFYNIPQVKQLLYNWKLANQKIYEFHSVAQLTQQAITNKAPKHIIEIHKSKVEKSYNQARPIESSLENAVRQVTTWIGQMTFRLTAIIYILLGLMLYLGIKRALNAFHERDALYHATFHHANVGIIQLSLNGKIQRMNQTFCDMFSVTTKDMKNRNVKDILENHDNHQPQNIDILNTLSPDEPTFSYHFKIKSRKGMLLWLKATITKIFNQQNLALYHIAMIEDISELHAMNEQLKQMAHHDYLTGLSNKFAFENHLSNAVKEGQTGVLFYMDLDKFKVINDTAGHAAGDQALTEVAQVLRLSFKKDDMVARIGGDEFAAFVSNINLQVAEKIKTGITKSIEQHLITYQDQSFHIGISIGLAATDNSTLSSKQLMLQADTAAYESKSQRKA
ncbi:sensor domain-containing diguanylate cyclase [Marinicella rhabdoformis]|uniref:sensor domain-containing diguanylate cyclase n=1 Tax=Marinicella rhabdoformis TaxID=2580566 RepID=UPI0012AECEE5|nr:sensor domain-containing diguanylate cyclase [Marinicella rhabdoformis]